MRKQSLQIQIDYDRSEQEPKIDLSPFKKNWRKASLQNQNIDLLRESAPTPKIQHFSQDSPINPNQFTEESQQSPISTSKIDMKKRKASFIEFENNKKNIVDKLIKYDTLAHFSISQLNDEEDEMNIYSSDIYIMHEGVWKNREIKSLTSKAIASVNIKDISKIKLKSEPPIDGYRQLRVTSIDQKMHYFAVRQSCIDQWFSASVWVCLVNVGCESRLNQQKIKKKQGIILKKGQILGKWEPRYVKIDDFNGLQSRKSQQEKPSLRIKETSELWTRLERIEEDKYVVLKLWNMFIKYEFGIPIDDCEQWLRAFCLLTLKKKCW